MGVPSIVIALSSDQREIAKGLAKNDIVASLGWHADLSEERIAEAILSLLNDQKRRAAMCERGMKLVDGQGAARVVKFLRDSL
jgi:spore coat polysaccharide biosynthesis predicted glycosyltransferase SpsG